MLSGRGGLQCSAVNPKGSFPLGPFPRHVWIHHNTPQDSLDKACHEIWKRVQGLPEELQPKSSSPLFQPSCHLVLSSESLRENSRSTGSSSQKEWVFLKIAFFPPALPQRLFPNSLSCRSWTQLDEHRPWEKVFRNDWAEIMTVFCSFS